MSNAMTVTAATWATEVLASPIPVLADFWAPWCGPCRAVAPVIDELATELAGKVKFVKINIDEEQQLAAQFMVQSIPTLLIIKSGKVAQQIVGMRSKQDLASALAAHLAG